MRTRWVMGLGALFAVSAVVVLLVVPTYSVSTTTGSTSTDTTATLLEVNGPGALVPLAVAVVLAVGAWAAPWSWLRWSLVGLFGAGCVLAMLSIGIFFLPAAALLGAGALREAAGSGVLRQGPARPA